MKKLILSLFVLLTVVSCESDVEDNRTECQKNNIGYLALKNTSDDPYDVFINGTFYKQFPGNSYTSNYLKYAAGKSYTVKVQQASGYILYPTVKNYTFTLNQCDEKSVIFP